MDCFADFGFILTNWQTGNAHIPLAVYTYTAVRWTSDYRLSWRWFIIGRGGQEVHDKKLRVHTSGMCCKTKAQLLIWSGFCSPPSPPPPSRPPLSHHPLHILVPPHAPLTAYENSYNLSERFEIDKLGNWLVPWIDDCFLSLHVIEV